MTNEAMQERCVRMPAELSEETKDLVAHFAEAVAAKLRAAEQKYGYATGWKDGDWMEECRDKLKRHLRKGDPRDVAAYCAFLWHHGAPTYDASDRDEVAEAGQRQCAEKAENRERQLRVEIKTLVDEKAALEARVAELLGLLEGIAPQKLTTAVAGYFEAQDAVIHIGADAAVFEAARIELEATLRQLQLPLASIDAALKEGGK